MAQLHNRVIAPRRPIHLGDWLVEPMLDRMSRGEQIVQLRPRAMDVLACLALPFKLEGEGGDYPLAQGTNLIGRTADAVVLIDRTEVSRCHARIVVEGTAATLEDLGSKNGTYLNGQRLRQPSVLTDGDEIWIGRSVARFRFVAEGEPTTTENTMT